MKPVYFHLKTLIKYLLLPFGFIYKLIKRNKDEILILMYHRVAYGVNMELGISPATFKKQMDYLYKKDYRIITMDQAYNIIKEGTIDRKYVVITFDDGYMDFYKNAYPILKSYDFPSIIYLCPGYIDTQKKYWWDEKEKDANIMGWQEILTLQQGKMVDFGCHTMDHLDMDSLSVDEVRNQLDISKKILENRLDMKVRHFSYPRGIYSNTAKTVAMDYYDTGVLTSSGRPVNKDCGGDCLYRLKRIPVLKSDRFLLFIARLKGYLIAEEFIRRHLLG